MRRPSELRARRLLASRPLRNRLLGSLQLRSHRLGNPPPQSHLRDHSNELAHGLNFAPFTSPLDAKWACSNSCRGPVQESCGALDDMATFSLGLY